jgi:DNA-binding beta-propeller fold protein YncE
MIRHLCIALLLMLLGAALLAVAQDEELNFFKPAGTIVLKGVEGRIDHLAADLHGKRLFVAALGNNTVEVLDLAAGKAVHRIEGLKEPQGIVYVPESGHFAVANGDDGSLRIFDGKTYQVLSTLDFKSDADNVRFDAAAKHLWVGYGKGALGVADAAGGKVLGNIALPGHPESFQLEKSGPRIFVNVPTAGVVVVLDRIKQTVVAKWPLGNFEANYPMALDEADQRLFVVTRKPARLLVLDTKNGRKVAVLPCVGDADDVFYDATRKRLYVTGGAGFVTVIEQRTADQYKEIAKIGTAAGARTSLWVPELNRLYVAVPHRGSQHAEIRIFEAQ